MMFQVLTLLRSEYSTGCTEGKERISSVVTRWRERFTQKKVPEPDVCAEYIVAHVIGQKTVSLEEAFFYLLEIRILVKKSRF